MVQAQCFDEVVRCSSFRAAAVRLGLSQPSVSSHVANLERGVGVRLLDRSTRGIRLTGDGERLLPLVRGLLAAEHALAEESAAVKDGLVTRLRVATVRAGITGVLPAVLPRLRDEHPDLEVEINQAPTPDVLQGIRAGTYDLGVVGHPGAAWSGDLTLEAHVITTQPVGVCARRGHAGLQGSPIEPQALAGIPLILLGAGSATREVADALVDPHPEQVRCVVDDADSAVALAAAGLGVAVTGPTEALRHHPEVLWVPLAGDHMISLSIVHQRGGPVARAARDLVTIATAHPPRCTTGSNDHVYGSPQGSVDGAEELR